MDLRFDVREFNTDMDALKRLEDALDVMQLNMHEALIATEQLEPKKAIALIKKAAGESRQAVFAWVWLKDRAASNNKFEPTRVSLQYPNRTTPTPIIFPRMTATPCFSVNYRGIVYRMDCALQFFMFRANSDIMRR